MGMKGTERTHQPCRGVKPKWSLQRSNIYQPRKTTGSWWLTAPQESFTLHASKSIGPAPLNMPDYVMSANGKLEKI